ncbi:Protein of unknown function [Parasphingorhabdus marina DSM 22363]|uniref:DUF4197 domain-containing protein n=1 Tax=Parasphingorhabdus marina DSM 22363 TaxID=1123272 RepID=A0A1N6D878_9SPHN|nr:DUF4197 domain-containing protein [Parasphingorhabdus marina]SIN67021.1 Protein of unknown function [Parasphingorhabdus marina DSM 22363]
MKNRKSHIRHALALGLMAVPLSLSPLMATSAHAQSTGVKSLLADASDGALDKLSQPGAFYADKAVRILLPGPLKNASKILRFTSKAGLTRDITRDLNDAAGKAALEAKPVFRSAIDNLTLTEGVGIVTGGNSGGTDYLRKTAGEELGVKIRPLVERALEEVGAYDQMAKLGDVSALAALGGADFSRDGLTDSVTDQALDGIFSYIASEEANFRSNPLDKGKDLLKGIF